MQVHMPVNTWKPEEGVGSLRGGVAGIGGSPGFFLSTGVWTLHLRVVGLLVLNAESTLLPLSWCFLKMV